MVARDEKRGTVAYDDPDTGERMVTPVTRGMVKCQWKADWAMRWTALGVDYEMAGKDLIDSVTLSSKICRALGGTPPEGFNYELFLDDNQSVRNVSLVSTSTSQRYSALKNESGPSGEMLAR